MTWCGGPRPRLQLCGREREGGVGRPSGETLGWQSSWRGGRGLEACLPGALAPTCPWRPRTAQPCPSPSPDAGLRLPDTCLGRMGHRAHSECARPSRLPAQPRLLPTVCRPQTAPHPVRPASTPPHAPNQHPTPCTQPAPNPVRAASSPPPVPRRQAGELTFPCKAEGGVCIGTPCHPRALCQPPSSPRLLSQVGAPAVGALFFLVTHRPLGLPLWAQVPWHPI